jgi:DNA-binding CsgD family transcriptional regulator
VPSYVADPIMNDSIDLLRSHFGLTRAEARLALHLVAGETLRSAEAKLGVTYETARTHLKNIFSKTGTCRQAELVVVIVTALPGCMRLGSNEQISGAIEQIPGRGQSD